MKSEKLSCLFFLLANHWISYTFQCESLKISVYIFFFKFVEYFKIVIRAPRINKPLFILKMVLMLSLSTQFLLGLILKFQSFNASVYATLIVNV